MKRIGILFGLISISILFWGIVFPKSLGEHAPIWKLKERCFGNEYYELQSQYFITLSNSRLWYEEDSIFYIWNDHDIFTITEVYLQVSQEIAEDCKITTSGIIRWQKQSLPVYVRIKASALTNDALSVRVGGCEYSLDETEDSINDFEEETGIEAKELLETISKIRSEYISTLQKLSEAEYQNVWNKIYKRIMILIVMWGIYILLSFLVRIYSRFCENRLDKDMKNQLDGMDNKKYSYK